MTRPSGRVALAGTALAVFAGSVLVVATRSATPAAAATGSTDTSVTLATVTRQRLESQVETDATLGYRGSYTCLAVVAGMVTALPSVGQVVRRGAALYAVDGAPVALFYGAIPFYRALSAGATGPDVRQLNANLVALGLATRAQLDPASTYFGWVTARALRALQAKLGTTKTGALAVGAATVQPGPVRVTALTAQLGTQLQPGGTVLQATSTDRQVSIALDSSQQSSVAKGDRVRITLPDQSTTSGVVSSVGTVATKPASDDKTQDTTPTVPVVVIPTDPKATGVLDQAPVQVAITTDAVDDAVVVPVASLLALAGGGYAVDRVGTGGVHHLVGVGLGLFDDADGLVQVTGSDLAAGQRVVVPSV